MQGFFTLTVCLLLIWLLYPLQNGWRFSLRWLIVVTTLIAMALGLLVADDFMAASK
jgi:hypothetical protein